MTSKNSLRYGSYNAYLLIFFISLLIVFIANHLKNYFLIAPLIIAIIISYLTTRWIIPRLKKYRINQIIRVEGPEAHYKKSGTPTMGGLTIVPIGLLVGNLLSIGINENKKLLLISFISLAYMAIGALDDWRSLCNKKNSGLSPKHKIFLQTSAGLIFLFTAYISDLLNPLISLPLQMQLNNYFVFIPIAIFVFIAESNSTNLTDGLDGLASGCGALVFTGLAIELSLRGTNDNLTMAYFCLAMAGTWLGFLIHNQNPAKIFMGDTGSLAMGGALSGISLLSNTIWPLFIMGGVFFAESMSVIIQVWFFKLSKKYSGRGKRIFLMTPIHHHFEIKGANENTIVTSFWICTIALIGLSLIFLRIY